MLRNTQGQILQQKLSPQAIQAQLLLAIPTMALEQEIKKQLEENPVLEDSVEESQAAEDTAAYEYGQDNWNDFPTQRRNSDISDEERTEYLINKQAKTKESPIEQVYRMGLETNELIIAEEIIGSIEDDGYLRIPLEEIAEDITEKFGFTPSPEEMEQVLGTVQRLDPVGIAARNLEECLSIQLKEPGNGLDETDRDLCLKMIN
ncbi:MAG TPA: hypothetical protein PKA39_04575, partial [Ignavibacteria bacterium]|nr:hypothetical protein [Ignavibacteria bacterium]